ncbi:MAG: polysaccharide deacetylase family protein [Myxococcales bacterium]|nr:polysaccharide deacetylase family protein [Myxococcales bacterium]
MFGPEALRVPRPARLVVFWDYDTQWGADRSRAPGGPKAWGPLEFEHTERLLELHAQYDVPACFAVVGAAALPGDRPYHDPAQVRRIHAAGHEVGSHSLQHDWLPGLDPQALRHTLAASKDALEQCIQAPVCTFVPPYNQPFDYPRGLSISRSERRTAGRARTGLGRLAATLREVGYDLCRVAYRPLPLRLVERVARRRFPWGARPVQISGLLCLRTNAGCGFDAFALGALRQVVASGGVVVAHAHPHSLSADNAQHERFLVPFLEQVADLRRRGDLRPMLPRELVRELTP